MAVEGGETSAEMLKNTPSNIRRLAHEIEQCEGRHKYLANTTSPSDGGDVRWYFCKVPLAENELAASVPRTEIVGKSDYFRFGMRDSLAIEASFLQKEEELLSSWWKEYAECSEGPRGRPSSSSKLDLQLKSSVLESSGSTELFQTEEERVGVPVKGGLYEVDLLKRHCFPVYWNGENRRVLRGHWFARNAGLDWLPVREDIAEQLEYAYRGQVWHRRTFQQSGLFAARIDLQGSTLGLHALFTGEDDTWEAWLRADASGLSSIISLGRSGVKLRRGYAPSQSPKPTQDELRQQKEEEMDDYCSEVQVQHLVFMVHGIGQRLEKSNLVDDVATFRQITANLAERHLTSYQRDSQRVLFIPCQWRRDLKLSGEAAVEKLTLDGVRGLRVMLSATAHDILYYMSPIYCQAIIDSVTNQLNRLYLKFLKRNPGYNGKVSLYGHSLGSVLSYDILCHQDSLSSPFPADWVYNGQGNEEKSLLDTGKQSLASSSGSNLLDKNIILHGESKGTEDLIHKDDISVQSNFSVVKEHSIDSSIRTELPVSLDSNDQSPSPLDIVQPTADSSPDEDIGQPNIDQSSTLLYEADDLNKTTTRISGELIGESNSITEEMPGGNEIKSIYAPEEVEVKSIEALKEEIHFLRARLKELESHSATLGSPPVSEKPSSGKDNSIKNCTPYINYKKLVFKVDTFFAVGSPLGVFLAIRNVRIGIGKGQDYWEEENIIEEMPACRQMFNIFHPFDPVAYRLEPLICKEYVNKRPVIIPYHRGGKRLHIGFQEFAEDVSARSQAIIDRISSVKVKMLTLCHSRSSDNLDEESEDTHETEERSYGSYMLERLTGSEEGRLDYVLQDKTFQHPYISVVGAHTNYWRDYDTALFMLKHLYQDTPEEPYSPFEPLGDSSKHNTVSEGWLDQREEADEELPLTFADKVSINTFSRKAKKIMKR